MYVPMPHPRNLSKRSENVIAHQKKTPDNVKTILITQTFHYMDYVVISAQQSRRNILIIN